MSCPFPSSPSPGLILVTGANGYIAAQTIAAFLASGWHVRGTVRSLSSPSTLRLQTALSGPLSTGQLSLVEVPDMTRPGAFDAAFCSNSGNSTSSDVTAVAHLASPVSVDDSADVEAMTTAVADATVALLEAAAAAAAARRGGGGGGGGGGRVGRMIKSFVLMSSIVAVRSFERDDGTYTDDDWNVDTEKLVREQGAGAGGVAVYTAGKIRGERAFWEWVEREKPGFAATSLCPVWVSGPPLYLPESPAQIALSTQFVYEILAGHAYPAGPAGYGAHVDVRDVARMTLFAASHPEVAGGQRYIVGGNGNFGCPQATADILREAYPGRRDVIREGTRGQGYRPGYGFFDDGIKFVSDKAVKHSGRDWIPYDKMVLDAAKVFEGFL
ncbi:hypothetical protein F4778DRAFT_784843 [Xylariomycetidae sp. FL2044]|nr:hypothetical protein F4778DRAFT_784843 [Xylariomycetidae sp. FL2044]